MDENKLNNKNFEDTITIWHIRMDEFKQILKPHFIKGLSELGTYNLNPSITEEELNKIYKTQFDDLCNLIDNMGRNLLWKDLTILQK